MDTITKQKDLNQDKHQSYDVLYNLLVEKKKSYREAGNILGVNHRTVSKWAVRFGIKSVHRNCWPIVKRKNNLNDEYFQKIDSPNKAYLLGLLITDGSVREVKNVYKISLALKDKEALDFFSKEIAYTGKIYGKDFYRLEFTSKKMFGDLGKYGIVPRKTFNARIKKIPKKFLYDYLRGVLDGDGCYHKGGIIISSASRYFLTDIEDILRKDSIIGGIYKVKNTKAFVLSLRKKASEMLIKKIFSSNKFAIARKKERALMFAEMKV